MNNKGSRSTQTQSGVVPLLRATAILAFCALLFPLLAQAGSGAGFSLEKHELASKQDFLEYASLHDVNIHELYFGAILYEGTESCLMCHEEEGRMVLEMGHFKWQGETDRIAGLEGGIHGKNDLLNNFCIAVPTNEGRCTQCHIGYGYADAGFDFNDPTNIDCLVCHDQSGTYEKDLTTAGMPKSTVDLNLVARSISLGGKPTRKNCIGCHAFAGGGDNVKHGDLSTDLLATTRQYDVHMATDGANFDCVDCHAANHDPKTGEVNHGMAPMSLHSVNEGEMRQCTDCHGALTTVHADTPVGVMFEDGWHGRLACQVCHIPAIARAKPTKVEWYWADAGQDIEPTPIDQDTGMPAYNKKKGSFNWSKNVRPTLRYFNGNWDRMVIGISDTYDQEPVQLATPLGDAADPDAMIYPFKVMKGNQPVDPVTKTVLVPHLFGKPGGPNPYWAKYDWGLALQDGANYTGQNYSGSYAFATTEMLLSVNHEVAPADQALGYLEQGGGCADCHGSDAIDWPALGWTADPTDGGRRAQAAVTAPSADIGSQ
jgi:octaheme c-type cytochrome (tetrathionate reductase family)